jgi:YHS domain-containing protein
MAVALPVGAYAADALKKVEPQYVCMINNKLFDKPQIPVTVGGKTYYGCCPMCKEKLEKSAEARSAADPVSRKTVDKATAVIGAAADGTVHYFENEENLQKFGGAHHDHGGHKH